MRFNLEPGGAFCDGKNKLVTVKINDEEKIHLPYTSYIFDKLTLPRKSREEVKPFLR